MGLPAVESGPVPLFELTFWNTFLMLGCLTQFDAGEGTWSFLNLMYHAFLTPLRSLSLSEWSQRRRGDGGMVEGRWGKGTEEEEGGETVVCK